MHCSGCAKKQAPFECFVGGVVMESSDVLHEIERLIKAVIVKKQG